METNRIENHTLETSKAHHHVGSRRFDVRASRRAIASPYFFRTSSGFRQSGLRNIIAT
ncbi:hypothetical protein F3P66_06080 [Agrobacterium fabrum]|uniref:Uncharacterized protein n=1 Tax=Agrobacterium fabrum (strain C58 / ATCC 33970) TaxID=176299 RepID=Q8UEW3_AGRFC|nr:hypothetical protein Atu1641 [Agrobacterium fabrum str. C58]QRM59053.1 hypothetical protein F3P66_06080 [Agrobacterium fabrum]TRB26965.1 hypothetical protein EXN51_20965 [Agrobacterium fabrum]